MAAADGKVKIGKGTKVYYSVATTGALAGRTWVYYGQITGVTRKDSKKTVEIPEYGSDWIKYITGHRDLELSLTITRRPGLTAYDLLQTAYNAGDDLGILLLEHGANPTEAGARWWAGDCLLESWEPDLGPEGRDVAVGFKLSANSAFDPVSVTVA